MKLTQRLEERERYVWDGRKFSADSRRAFAEALYEDDFERAFRIWFEAAVDESVDEWLPPYRDVEGSISVDSDVELEENQRVRVHVTLGDEELTRNVSGESSYRFRDVEVGGYDVVFEPLVVVEYDDETLDTTEYEIEEYKMSTENGNVAVDTEVTARDGIDGPTTTLTELTIGGEVTDE